MQIKAIVLKGHKISEEAFDILRRSTFDPIQRFDAVTPEQVDPLMESFGLTWNYPWEGKKKDHLSGLFKTAYPTKNPAARIACALSHYSLWEECADSSEDYLILEHDVRFLRAFPPDWDSPFGATAINNPHGATFMSTKYDQLVRRSKQEYVPVPMLTRNEIPQGLPGHSAYVIKPYFAKKMLKAAKKYGLWPNDALMCQQLFPGELGIIRHYITCVQVGWMSTTSS